MDNNKKKVTAEDMNCRVVTGLQSQENFEQSDEMDLGDFANEQKRVYIEYYFMIKEPFRTHFPDLSLKCSLPWRIRYTTA